MLDAVTKVVGSVGIVLSILLLAWQTRELTKQVRTSNAVATLNAMNNGLERLHSFLNRLADDPSLRPFFYESLGLENLEASRKSQVLTVSEMLADIIDYGLASGHHLKTVAESDDWTDYALFLIGNSPAFRHVLESNPDSWWMELARVRQEAGRGAHLEPDSAPGA